MPSGSVRRRIGGGEQEKIITPRDEPFGEGRWRAKTYCAPPVMYESHLFIIVVHRGDRDVG